MPRAQYYRGPQFEFDRSIAAPEVRSTSPPSSRAFTEAECERHMSIHESGHATVASILGCVLDDVRIDKWTGRGMVRARYGKDLSVPDLVTVLVAGGVAERMIGGPQGTDRDDIADARRLGTDEQIKRAQERASELLRRDWRGVYSVADALVRWPYLKGSTVRVLLEASRKARLAR
jgi:hypothetical protein